MVSARPLLDPGGHQIGGIVNFRDVTATHAMAAEMAWKAAHEDEAHYLVGKNAKQARFMSRFFPNMLRKRLKKTLPAHNEG